MQAANQLICISTQIAHSILHKRGFISFVILAVYVDDIIPPSNDVNMLKVENESLCKEFEMVDQGKIHFILGMSIMSNRTVRTLSTSQENYLESLQRLRKKWNIVESPNLFAKVSKFYFTRGCQLCVSKRIMTFETFGIHRPSKGNQNTHQPENFPWFEHR